MRIIRYHRMYAGRIWRWADARALTSDEIERKAKAARDAAVELAGKQDEKVAEKRAKLKKLWEGADAVWRKCTAAEGTTYQGSLVDLSNSDLRRSASKSSGSSIQGRRAGPPGQEGHEGPRD
jgi:enoyl-[acyl-carrier-protein] reductase (NADH)